MQLMTVLLATPPAAVKHSKNNGAPWYQQNWIRNPTIEIHGKREKSALLGGKGYEPHRGPDASIRNGKAEGSFPDIYSLREIYGSSITYADGVFVSASGENCGSSNGLLTKDEQLHKLRVRTVAWIQYKSWLKLSLSALGGFGLVLAAFIDSSFVPLPLVTDLSLMELSSRHPCGCHIMRRRPPLVPWEDASGFTCWLGRVEKPITVRHKGIRPARFESSSRSIRWPAFFFLRLRHSRCRSNHL